MMPATPSFVGRWLGMKAIWGATAALVPSSSLEVGGGGPQEVARVGLYQFAHRLWQDEAEEPVLEEAILCVKYHE